MSEFCYVIKHLKQDTYLSLSPHRPLWTKSLIFAKRFISLGDAMACSHVQGGCPHLVLIRLADLDDVAEEEERSHQEAVNGAAMNREIKS